MSSCSAGGGRRPPRRRFRFALASIGGAAASVCGEKRTKAGSGGEHRGEARGDARNEPPSGSPPPRARFRGEPLGPPRTTKRRDRTRCTLPSGARASPTARGSSPSVTSLPSIPSARVVVRDDDPRVPKPSRRPTSADAGRTGRSSARGVAAGTRFVPSGSQNDDARRLCRARARVVPDKVRRRQTTTLDVSEEEGFSFLGPVAFAFGI